MNDNIKYRYKINDNIYDLTDFVDKHPGGKDIFKNLKKDTNITPIFYSYHKNPEKNKSVLSKYKIDNVENIDIEYDINYDYTNYVELKELVYKEINDKKIPQFWSNNEMIYNCSYLSLYFGIWIYNLIYPSLSNWWMILLSIMNSHCNMIFHESCHYSISKNQNINRLFLYVIYPLMDEKSWKYSHNYQHHCFTNTEYDGDLETPYSIIRHYDKQKHYIYNYFQNIYIYFLYCFITLKRIIIAINNHHRGYIVLLLLIFRLGYYKTLLWNMSCSFIFIFISQLSHIQEECINEKNDDFLIQQVVSSTNYKTNMITKFLCFSLDIQIEHHLFPNLPHSSLRKIKHIVKKYCDDKNIQYIERESIFYCIKSYIHYIYLMSKKKKIK